MSVRRITCQILKKFVSLQENFVSGIEESRVIFGKIEDFRVKKKLVFNLKKLVFNLKKLVSIYT